MTEPEQDIETTVDGFLDNSVFVVQPKKGAHRSGLDAILLAGAIPQNAVGKVADFGAGCGAAGLAVAKRCPHVDVELVEIDPLSIERAQDSIQLQENRSIAPRLGVLQADIGLSGIDRTDAGLTNGRYDHIISNPPFNSSSLQRSPDENRARAHVMDSNLLDAWVKTAAAAARNKGTLTVILRPAALKDLLSALGGRFGAVRILPIHPRSGIEANRLIVQAQKGSRGQLVFLPSFLIHGSDGSFTDRAEEIFRGRAALPI